MTAKKALHQKEDIANKMTRYTERHSLQTILIRMKNEYQAFFLYVYASLFFQYHDFPNPRFFELLCHTFESSKNRCTTVFLVKVKIASEMCSWDIQKWFERAEFEITIKFIRRLTVNSEGSRTFVRVSEC